MKKRSTFNKFILLSNIIAVIVLIFAYLLPFIPPKTAVKLSVLSLIVPFLIVVNMLFFFYWLFIAKKQAWLSFFVVLFGYFTFGSIYKISSPSKEKQPKNTLGIMNYNVRLFNKYNWIKADSISQKIIRFVALEKPDVLCIQEYQPLQEKLPFKYKFEKLSGTKNKYGQAIFSNYPIVNSGSVNFPNTANNAIYTDLKINTDTIRVYNIHLQSLKINPNPEELTQENSEKLVKTIGDAFIMQQEQAALFLKHQATCKYPTIISGDFNNTAYSYVYKKIKGTHNDAFEIAGNGFGRTYDFSFFPTRIDFILTPPKSKVLQLKTYSVKYSDHFPIQANLQLPIP